MRPTVRTAVLAYLRQNHQGSAKDIADAFPELILDSVRQACMFMARKGLLRCETFKVPGQNHGGAKVYALPSHKIVPPEQAPEPKPVPKPAPTPTPVTLGGLVAAAVANRTALERAWGSL